MGPPIRLVIVHPSRLFRECLVAVLANNPSFQALGADPGAAGLPASLEAQQPDVVLLALGLPDQLTLHLTRELHRRLERVKIILLARGEPDEHLLECIAAGAQGCVLEQATVGELQRIIARVRDGELFCSPEIVQTMFAQLAHFGTRGPQWVHHAAEVSLTPRELEILQFIAGRMSNKEIAKRLSLSLHTVKNHVHNIVEKLQVDDRHQAVAFARQRDWLQRGPSFGDYD